MVDFIPQTSAPTDDVHDYSGAFGNRFNVAATTYVNAVSYYLDPAHSTQPTRLSIYDLSTSTRVWTTTSVGSVPGSAGWVSVPVSPQLTMVSGRDYLVCVDGNTGFYFRGWSTAPPTLGAGFTLVGARYGNGEPPGLVSGWELVAISVSTAATAGGDGGTGGSTGVGAPTFSGDLAAWLSSNGTDQLHETDGLPWLTKAKVDDTNTKVTSGLNLAGGLQALSDSLANTLQLASDYVAGRTGTYFTDLKNRLIGASGGGGSAFFGPDGTQVSAGVEALLARSTNAQVGFPASPWEMTAETDFDGCLAWAQPADLYTVTFATTPPTIPDNGQCGVPVRYRLAWWTSLNGEFAQERHWIDFEKCHLVDPAGRMPGLLLQTYLGGTGHVEAWTLNV
jgi:hypothetical protein